MGRVAEGAYASYDVDTRVPELELYYNAKSDASVSLLLELIRPMLVHGRTELRRTLSETWGDTAVAYEDTVVERLYFNLCDRLLWLVMQTTILELNIARLEDRLEGETPEERFLGFVESLRRPREGWAMLEQYPVLGKLVANAMSHWLVFVEELATRLRDDWEEIKLAFRIPNSAPLVSIEPNAGDQHSRGRTVSLLRFECGARIVYKPRSCSVDVHFTELVHWLNAHFGDERLRGVHTLDKGKYAWSEFIDNAPLSQPDDDHRFYTSLGSLLGLVYYLEGVDIHAENLIASGRHPVIVDLETIFHPRLSKHKVRRLAVGGEQAELGFSVLRVGMLPTRVLRSGERDGVELSAVAGDAGQVVEGAMLKFANEGTDKMTMVPSDVVLEGSENRPKLGNGELIDPRAYVDDIITGYRDVCRVLNQCAGELVDADGPLARFAADKVRVILRPTFVYAMLLQRALHPNVLRSGLAWDRCLDRLWRGTDRMEYLQEFIAYECADLESGDIPAFSAIVGESGVRSSEGAFITTFSDESSLSVVRRRCQDIDARDVERQCWYIRASLATLYSDEANEQWPAYDYARFADEGGPVGQETLIDMARTVADRLDELAFPDGDGVNWMGLSLVGEKHRAIVPLRPDLYDGLAGVVLFLAHIAALTPGPCGTRYKTLALAGLATMERQFRRYWDDITNVGAFEGWGGTVYTLAHVYALWQSPDILETATECARRAAECAGHSPFFDVIGGKAGLILGLLSLDSVCPDDWAAQTAAQVGRSLLADATEGRDMLVWEGDNGPPLCGFSHGASGISVALLRLYTASGDRVFRDGAIRAVRYERSVFDDGTRSWPDFRPDIDDGADDGSGMCAWCHGAAGIGLARIEALRLGVEDGRAYEEDIECAARLVHRDGLGTNHSLCHGDLGNLEFFRACSELRGEGGTAAIQTAAVEPVANSIRQLGWLCGLPRGIEVPGLMTGISGIGFGLLRAVAPRNVPSILTLEPPRTDGGISPP